MSKTTVKLQIDPDRSSITFSKNFRIFSTTEPISGVTEFTDFVEDLIVENEVGLDLANLVRHFRYSKNRLDWSLWYEVAPGDLGDASSIVIDKTDDLYFEVKYTYDDGSNNEINGKISVNEIKLRFKNSKNIPTSYSPVTMCSDESCSSIVAARDPSFRPYDVDSAIGMYKEMSYYTNVMLGHQVVYFRTLPDSSSGDYIFKEWTLYKNIDRKCVKAVVPKNAFPSNQPRYVDSGLDFQMPFEVHIDHRYFQSVFGKDSEPRRRDFLYFPLINRMFEVQGSYLHRGFMMAPIFWKIQLKKFNPNIDMLMTDDSRKFLENVITSAEQLFGSKVESDIKDATMPQQYQTISRAYDPSRGAIHPDLTIKPLRYTYNFSNLIENYYDMGSVPREDETVVLTDPPVSSISDMIYSFERSLSDLSVRSHYVCLAYENSRVFALWRDRQLMTNDIVKAGTSTLFCRVRGPFDSIENHDGESEYGRYIRIEGYLDLSLTEQTDILTEVSGLTRTMTLGIRGSGVVYNASPKFDLDSSKNLTFTCLFNLKTSSTRVEFIDGFDPLLSLGVKISGDFARASGESYGSLVITVTVNDQVKTMTISQINCDVWHSLVVSMSNEFLQFGAYVYRLVEDPGDQLNHNAIDLVKSDLSSLEAEEFDLTHKYSIPSSNVLLSNLRVFNTMLREEEHEFIISQQYIKDESMLVLIDNCKPQVNQPFIAKNK